MSSPATDPRRCDRITLTGLGGVGYHGVFEKERRSGQPFFVDLNMFADLRPAGTSDALETTVHYGEVASVVRDIVSGPPFQLIESLAHAIATTLLTNFPLIDSIEVTVHKPKAPIEVSFSDVSVSIHRTREDVS